MELQGVADPVASFGLFAQHCLNAATTTRRSSSDQYTDPTDAYKIAHARFTSGELAADYANRRELTDAIEAAIKDSCISCPYCEKMLSD